MKEAAVQRKHNLYRDSIVLTSSDPNLHLLEEQPIDWARQYGGGEELAGGGNRKRRQVVSMIQLEGMGPLPYGSCLEVPGVEEIPEETEAQVGEDVQERPPSTVEYVQQHPIISEEPLTLKEPGSPDSVDEIRQLINPVVEVVIPLSEEGGDPVLTNGMVHLEEGQEVKAITTVTEVLPRDTAVKSAIQELDTAVQEDTGEHMVECAVDSDVELIPPSAYSSPRHNDDSGFQSPTNEHREEEPHQITQELKMGEAIVDPVQVMVTLEQEVKVYDEESEAGETKEWGGIEDDSDVVSEI